MPDGYTRQPRAVRYKAAATNACKSGKVCLGKTKVGIGRLIALLRPRPLRNKVAPPPRLRQVHLPLGAVELKGTSRGETAKCIL
jgi:hypothetical protein